MQQAHAPQIHQRGHNLLPPTQHHRAPRQQKLSHAAQSSPRAPCQSTPCGRGPCLSQAGRWPFLSSHRPVAPVRAAQYFKELWAAQAPVEAKPLVLPEIIFRGTYASADSKFQAPTARSETKYFRVRRYSPGEHYKALMQLQTDSFFNPPAIAPLRQLALVNFQAEVVDSIKLKERTLDENSFQMYVMEDITRAVEAGGHDIILDTCAWRPLGPPQPLQQQQQQSQQQPATAAPESPSDPDGPATAAASGCVLYYTDAPVPLQSRGPQERTPLPDPEAGGGTGAGAGAGAMEGALVGTVEVTRMDEEEVLRCLMPGMQQYAYLSSMTVRQQDRRRGLAQALLHVAQSQGRLWNQLDLALHVYEDNLPAVSLYRRQGFQVLDRDPAWKGMLGGRVRLLMQRPLF